MKRIVIGEEREYTRRLTGYLLDHLPADIQLLSFTSPELLLQEEPTADLFLLGEDFYEELIRLEPEFRDREVILIRNRQVEEGYFKLDPPEKLVRQICDFSVTLDPPGRSPSDSCQLIALYAPFPAISLRKWIWREMETGDLYLGLQDMGEDEYAHPGLQDMEEKGYTSSSEKKEKRDILAGVRLLSGRNASEPGASVSDMGSLCYYIHLHDEEILDHMKKMLHREEGKYYLESPSWFFDFLGLQEEDYRWFYQALKEDSGFSRIYIGLGNQAITSLKYFDIFDRVILLDDPDREKIHHFCDRFARTSVEEGYVSASSIEVRDWSGEEGR